MNHPVNVPEKDCSLLQTRPVWRLDNGWTEHVAYEICRETWNRDGKVPSIVGRNE